MLTQAQGRKRSYRQSEIGFLAGGSYYLGDINPRGHFSFTRPAAGVFFRLSNDYRYAFRAGLNYGKITASDSRSGEADQLERNLHFVSNIIEFNTIAEFNFLEYRVGSKTDPFTLYVFAGLAGYYFNPKSDLGNGAGLQPLRNSFTEGQLTPYPRLQLSVPFGVGFKFNIGNNCGLSVEWGPRRTFTDYLDDVSGNYPETLVEGGKSFTNRTLNNSATPGAMRGNPTTRDWYFYYGLTFNVKLREVKIQCYKSN